MPEHRRMYWLEVQLIKTTHIADRVHVVGKRMIIDRVYLDRSQLQTRASPSVITDAWSQCWVTLLGQTLPALQHHRLLPANVLGRSGPVGEHNNSRVVSADISIRGTA